MLDALLHDKDGEDTSDDGVELLRVLRWQIYLRTEDEVLVPSRARKRWFYCENLLVL